MLKVLNELKVDRSVLPPQPGVYQFFDANNHVLYVGKARNLKKRLASYFRSNLSAKTAHLMQQAVHFEITVTASENEALLLESNLIKQLKPKYNILLRDDKSYPYLYLAAQHSFPRLDFYRGAKKGKGQYFGPYLSVTALREILTLVQKLFKIRQCDDNFFNHRTRPCLQYQIKRCTAPCVGYVTVEDYYQQVQHAVMFLQGKNNTIIDQLVKQMETASVQLQYEKAAIIRDQIAKIRHVQSKQSINVGEGNIDVIALYLHNNVACVHVITIRNGQMLGSRSYFPKLPQACEAEEILEAFLPQYYSNPAREDSLPRRIVLNFKLEHERWIAAALTERLQNQIEITSQTRGRFRQWQNMAETNAKQAYLNYTSSRQHLFQRLSELQKALQLPNMLQRLECFDISHTQGKATVASCVVFTQEGAANQEYRRFNITDITAGDDYAAIKQVLTRRYKALKENEKPLPDIVLIDGGKGQLQQAKQVFAELQISGVTLLGIAKGEGRKPGLEKLFIANDHDQAIILPPDHPALHFLQHARDEAHRFAITGHRRKRQQSSQQSILEQIPNIGSKRRRQLLQQFGGLQGLMKANQADLTSVEGIGPKLAKEIFDYLHR